MSGEELDDTDYGAVADYYQAIADSQDSGRVLAAAKAEIAALKAEVERWKEIANDHAGKYAAGWDQGKQDRQGEIESLKKEIAALKADYELVLKQRDGFVAGYNLLQEQKTEHLNEIERLKAELDTARSIHEQCGNKILALKEEIERLTAELAAKELKWQTGKPPKDGYYWRRHGMQIWLDSMHPESNPDFIIDDDCQWAGPIEPPKEE